MNRPSLRIKSSSYQKKKKIIFFLILLLFFLIVVNLTSISKQIKNFFFFLSDPVQQVFKLAGKSINNFFTSFMSCQKIKEDFDNKEKENQKLINEIVELQALKKENEFLREALKIGLEKDYQLVLGRVIYIDLSHNSILINKGKKDGIKDGLPVITAEKLLIGKISLVYENFSEVMLISHPQNSFDVKLADKEIYGLAKGQGNGEILLDFLPREAEINQDDLIITSVLGGIYPPNLLVGKIKQINKPDIGTFQQAILRPLFDVKQLDYLLIITSF